MQRHCSQIKYNPKQQAENQSATTNAASLLLTTENRSGSVIAMMRTDERTKTKTNFGAGACQI
jgi:hypothetical protein